MKTQYAFKFWKFGLLVVFTFIGITSSGGAVADIDRYRLIERIKTAFATAPYPGDDNIALDPSGEDPESEQIAAHFKKVRWEGVNFVFLQSYKGDESAALNFMSPDAFRYYLPAFILVSLERFRDSDLVPDAVISALTLPDRGDPLYKYKYDRIKGFSPDQARAIRAFLEYMIKSHKNDFVSDEPRFALKSYWGNLP